MRSSGQLRKSSIRSSVAAKGAQRASSSTDVPVMLACLKQSICIAAHAGFVASHGCTRTMQSVRSAASPARSGVPGSQKNKQRMRPECPQFLESPTWPSDWASTCGREMLLASTTAATRSVTSSSGAPPPPTHLDSLFMSNSVGYFINGLNWVVIQEQISGLFP